MQTGSIVHNSSVQDGRPRRIAVPIGESQPSTSEPARSALSEDIVRSAQSVPREGAAPYLPPLVTITRAVEQAEHNGASSPGRLQSDLEQALQLSGRLDRTAPARRLIARLYFQLANHGNIDSRRKVRLYNDAAQESSLAGAHDVAGAARRAILDIAGPDANVEPTRAMMFRAVEDAYKSPSEPIARAQARATLQSLAQRYGADHPVRRSVDQALEFDAALDSQPAEKIEELRNASLPVPGLPRSMSSILSSSPLKASAMEFVPRHSAPLPDMPAASSSANSDNHTKSLVESLPSDDDFFSALTSASMRARKAGKPA